MSAGLGRLARAQVEAEVKTRLRSPSTIVAAFALFALSFLWIPDPASRWVSMSWGSAEGDLTTGVYNSAYVGASAAVLAALFLTIIGFYLVAGSVRRDEETRLGAILAATPLSKTAYLSGKLAAHFVYLMALGAVSLAAGMLVFLRYGSGPLVVADFVVPFAAMVVPALAFTAATAVLFDVTPGLRRRGGLVLFFFAWTFVFLMIPVLTSGGFSEHRPGQGYPIFDPAGLAGFTQWLAEAVPGGAVEGISIGLIQTDEPLTRVLLPGVRLAGGFALSRGLVFLWSLAVLGLAVAAFDRFDTSRRRGEGGARRKSGRERPGAKTIPETGAATGGLSEVAARDLASLPPAVLAPSFGRSVLGEMRLLWASAGWLKWPLLAAALAAAVPAKPPRPAVAAFLLLLAPVLSEAAAREKLAGTVALVFSQPGIPRSRLAWKLAAALGFVFVLGLPGLASLALTSPSRAAAYLAGLAFVAVFATAAGALTGGGKLFTGLYVALWYAAVNGGPAVDWSGAFAPELTAAPYAFAAAAGVLLVCAWVVERWQERPIITRSESFFGIEPLPPRGGVASNELIDKLREEDLE